MNAADKDQLTPLIEAVMAGHVDVLKELLKQGATPDAAVANGATALWLAAGTESFVYICIYRCGHVRAA